MKTIKHSFNIDSLRELISSYIAPEITPQTNTLGSLISSNDYDKLIDHITKSLIGTDIYKFLLSDPYITIRFDFRGTGTVLNLNLQYKGEIY